MNIRLEPCKPPNWARTGHAQTILGHILPSPKIGAKGVQHPIRLPDGDILVTTHYKGSSPFLVVVFHGLNGTSESGYMNRTARLALKQNHSVLLVNHRGCGLGKGLAKLPYHSGRGEDVSEVIRWSRETFPNKKIIAIGFSLGANALLNLLTERRGQHQPDMAITVNGPSDLKACSNFLKQGFNRVYDFHFVQMCRKDIHELQSQQIIPAGHQVPFFSYLNDIDKAYTAPRGGFKSADDYYESCSTYAHLENIKVPTFILMSKDDPFIPWQPYLAAQKNPNVQLHLEDVGGHMGYLSADGPVGYKRWQDYAIDTVLAEFTGLNNQ